MININYECKNLNEIKELLLFQKENNLNTKLFIENTDNKKICSKCWNTKRFVKWTNKYKSFYTCDICNPRKDWKFINQNSPDFINCSNCSKIITKKTSQFWDYYKCDCGFKIDAKKL